MDSRFHHDSESPFVKCGRSVHNLILYNEELCIMETISKRNINDEPFSGWLTPSCKPVRASVRKKKRKQESKEKQCLDFSKGAWKGSVESMTYRYIPNNGCYRTLKLGDILPKQGTSSHEKQSLQVVLTSEQKRLQKEIARELHFKLQHLDQSRQFSISSSLVQETEPAINVIFPPHAVTSSQQLNDHSVIKKRSLNFAFFTAQPDYDLTEDYGQFSESPVRAQSAGIQVKVADDGAYLASASEPNYAKQQDNTTLIITTGQDKIRSSKSVNDVEHHSHKKGRHSLLDVSKRFDQRKIKNGTSMQIEKETVAAITEDTFSIKRLRHVNEKTHLRPLEKVTPVVREIDKTPKKVRSASHAIDTVAEVQGYMTFTINKEPTAFGNHRTFAPETFALAKDVRKLSEVPVSETLTPVTKPRVIHDLERDFQSLLPTVSGKRIGSMFFSR